MKKLLLSSSIVVLLLPGLAFAAFNDVFLTTDVVLSVNGITVNVSGSTATIESIEVGSTNFIVTLEDGSSFEATAPDRNVLDKDVQAGIASDICNATKSLLRYTPLSGSAESVVTITPSATLCTGSTADTSGGVGSVRGSSASISAVTPVVPVVQVANNAEAIAAIKVQLIVLIKQLIAQLIAQLQAQIEAMQTSGSS